MNELSIHPNVYSTGNCKGLVSLLERVWIREIPLGEGTFYIVSCFGNYNGGVRFFDVFRRHIENGGRVVSIFSGSTQQHLTSIQVVEEMLHTGAVVHIVNRRRLMHIKSYGSSTQDGERIIVSSGNFTGPGMAQNVEVSLLLDAADSGKIGFRWPDMVSQMLGQKWHYYRPRLDDKKSPAWRLLYDEQASSITIDDTDKVTLVLTLGHADTVRINAKPNTTQSKGSQYFWLSKDCYDFFPPLTILNRRGVKRTYSAHISMEFVDIGETHNVRVTFEAENNLDFRLGTGPFRNTRVASRGDIAAVTRRGEKQYQIRIFRKGTELFDRLETFAVSFIGIKGKRYGFLSNQQFDNVLAGSGDLVIYQSV